MTLGKAAIPLFDDKEVSGVWPGTQAVKTRTRRKTVNALGFVDIESLYACRSKIGNKVSGLPRQPLVETIPGEMEFIGSGRVQR
jgi:hypothetical protein